MSQFREKLVTNGRTDRHTALISGVQKVAHKMIKYFNFTCAVVSPISLEAGNTGAIVAPRCIATIGIVDTDVSAKRTFIII